MSDYLGTRRKKSGVGTFFKVLLGLLVVAGLVGFGVVTFRSGETPAVGVEAEKPAIGKRTVFTVRAAEPKRGLTKVRVVLEQAGRTVELAEESFPPQPAWGVGPMTPELTMPVAVGKETVDGLVEGEATVRVVAEGAGTWLEAVPRAEEEVTLPVKLSPPSLEVRSRNIYPAQGGSEVVVYKVGEDATEHGVQAGDWFFSGYPLPGGEAGEQFALFAIPYDMGDVDAVHLVARDVVDNVVKLPFVDRFTPRPFARDTINVSEAVMKKVVPKIMARVPSFEDRGDLVKNYVAINSEMRKDNNQKIASLADETRPEFMWSRPFVQMSAQAVSKFADRRTYLHDGERIDQQDHLGFDLASTRRAPIPAANRGAVVFAGYLGIYGNTVIVDHGYGLMSLYSHLSEMSVEEGDVVERAQTIGRTGATGLALGDHLHFTMLLHGLPVTPLEWWDGHWIEDRIALKLGDALGFADEP